MTLPSIYINLEDDVSKIVARIKRINAKQAVLVCPKRCMLFSDPINLKLLKKQIDLLGKEVFILTMDEKGQAFAKEAGFALKFLPKGTGGKSISDVRVSNGYKKEEESILTTTVKEIKKVAKKIAPAVVAEHQQEHVQHTEIEVKVSENSFPSVTDVQENYKALRMGSRSHKMAAITAGVALVLVLVLVFFILPKAEVTVYARTEPVTRDMEISMSATAPNYDAFKLVMPAALINETVSIEDKFQNQGKKQVGNKASGMVKIYNFTKQPINLKAATTVLSVGGKNYNLINDIAALKPAVYKNAQTKEVDEASVGLSVEVIAVEGGEDHNLPAGTRMEITNQVFGSQPQFLYAKTSSEVTGGTTRYLSLISDSDIAAARAALEQRLLDQMRKKLQSEGKVLLDKAYTINDPNFITDNAVGTQTPTLTAKLEARLSGLVFKQSDLSSLILERINSTMAANKTLKIKNPDQVLVKVKSLDLNNQLAILEVHFEGQAVFNVNFPYLAPELAGKSLSEANEILRSKAEVDKIDIVLAPSWQKSLPYFSSKIKITVTE